MNKRLKVLVVWIPAVVWMVVISVFSSIPGEEMPEIPGPFLDKFGHFLEFLVLGMLLMRALSNSYLKMSLARIAVLAIMIASCYGALDEWHQRFIPGRTPDLLDFLADLIGLSLGVLLYKKRRGIASDKAF